MPGECPDLRNESVEVQVGFVLFPGLTQLDLTRPLQVLHRLPEPAPDAVPGPHQGGPFLEQPKTHMRSYLAERA